MADAAAADVGADGANSRWFVKDGSRTVRPKMIHWMKDNRCVRATGCVVAGALFTLMANSGCSTAKGRAFESPQEGASALIAALRPLNKEALREILGPESDEIVSSGDEMADQHAAADFVAAYERRHNIVVEDGKATLVVGDNDWPMPIPLVRSFGAWRFDTEEGEDEILARRIGRNELAAIATCRAIVDAQREYAALYGGGKSGEPVYAQKFASDPGQRNGLYWEAKPGEPQSPLGPEVVEAVESGYLSQSAPESGPRPFHGYYFRMLTAQGPSAPGGARSHLENGRMTGGFGVVAWPVDYGNSGIMTFIVCHRGVVYQQDLGEKTQQIAAEMSAFDPGPGWEIVEEDDAVTASSHGP